LPGAIIHLAPKNRALWPGQRGDRTRTCQIQRLSGCAKTVPPVQFTGASSPCQACNSTEPKMPVRLLKISVTYQPSTAVLKRPSSSWGEPKMLFKQRQLCISRQVLCTCQVTLYDQRDCFEASKRRLGYLAGNCKWVEKAVESKGADVAIFGTGKGLIPFKLVQLVELWCIFVSAGWKGSG
jgi:hypothetical protein